MLEKKKRQKRLVFFIFSVENNVVLDLKVLSDSLGESK